MSSPDLLTVRERLFSARRELGSWESVASRVGAVSGEALRLIAEGKTSRPNRKTIDAVLSTFRGQESVPRGTAREVAEVLLLLRKAVVTQEQLLARLTELEEIDAHVDDPIVTPNEQAGALPKKRVAKGSQR